MPKVRYMLLTQPVCSACNFPADTHSNAPCWNCGASGNTFCPGVVLECDWQRGDAVPAEHMLPNVLRSEVT